ncbi:MAG: hypothetical protein ACJAT3_000580 [Akkermansiaceae bacterium]|jgi:hypothetical protein
MEFGEVFHLLSFANIFDGLASDGAHREGGPSAGVTIEFGEDNAGDADFAVESLGDGDGLLTGGGVGDEEGLTGVEEFVKGLEFVEEVGVEFLAAGGVEDDDGAVLIFGPFDSAFGDFDEVFFSFFGGEDWDIDLLGELGQLVDGSGAVEVEGNEEGASAFFLQAKGELGGSGGFTGTVEAAKEDVSRRIEIDGGLVATEEFGEFVLEDFDDLLAGFDRFEDVGTVGFFLNAGDEVFDDTEFDIGFQESKADVAEGVSDVLFGDFPDTPEVPEGFVEAVSEI